MTRNQSASGKNRLQMHRAVDSYLSPLTEYRPVEDGTSCSQEGFVVDGASAQICAWSNEYAATDRQRMFECSTQHSVLHDHALGADANRSPVGCEHCPEQDPRFRTDFDVTRDYGPRCHPCRFVDTGGLPCVLNQHGGRLEQPTQLDLILAR